MLLKDTDGDRFVEFKGGVIRVQQRMPVEFK